MLLGEYKYHFEGDVLVEELPDGTIHRYDKNSGAIFIGCTSSALHDPPDPLGGA